jgi:hypothetical protein
VAQLDDGHELQHPVDAPVPGAGDRFGKPNSGMRLLDN